MKLVIDGSQVVKLIEGIEERIDMEGKLGEQIAGLMRSDAARQFASGGIPAWAPLKDRTVQQKRRMGYPRLNRKGMVPLAAMQNGRFGPGNILMRTMALYSSWTDEHDPHHTVEKSKNAVATGSALPYARHHQEGGKWLPRRPIVVTPELKTKAAGLVTAAITEAS